jgi:type III restriction enzyme
MEELIQQYRAAARQQAYQQFLLPEAASPLIVSPEVYFTYDPNPMHYPCSADYSLLRGQHGFHKHYYPTVGNLRPSGEEYQCAQYLDAHPKVKTWVRNLERRPQHAFWLQTSTDRFYPDFVCLLEDGRYLVVESKGEHLYDTPDSQEKRLIGAFWEQHSAGKCLFVMPKGANWQAIAAKIG